MRVIGGQELFDATESSYLDQIAHYAKEVAVRDVRITQLEQALRDQVAAQNAKPDEDLPDLYTDNLDNPLAHLH